jgi:hypothetical protein
MGYGDPPLRIVHLYLQDTMGNSTKRTILISLILKLCRPYAMKGMIRIFAIGLLLAPAAFLAAQSTLTFEIVDYRFDVIFDKNILTCRLSVRYTLTSRTPDSK